MEMATFGAGCFWHIEDHFRHLKGVATTKVGYSGGTTQRPSYEQVCSGKTGHTEVVQVTFDPKVISYEVLLDHFWKLHDPTDLQKTQYRSVIFYHNENQKEAAVKSKEKSSKKYHDLIVTEILPAQAFYPAEEYHQCYIEKQKKEK